MRVVRISSCGQYIVSMDDTQWRLWKPHLAENTTSSIFAGLERVEYFRLPETVPDSFKMYISLVRF